MLRHGKSHKDIVYRLTGSEPDYVNDERVAIFMGPDAEYWATALVTIMNAERDDCTCMVVCPQCAAFTGTSKDRGCEYCAAHAIECRTAGAGIGHSDDRTIVQRTDSAL